MKRTLASVLTGALITMGAVVGVAAPASAADHHTLSAVTTAESPTGVELAVSGSGYSDVVALPGQAGPSVYVAIVERGSFVADQTTSPAVSLSVGVGGSIEGTLEVPVAALDRSKSYDILSWPTRSFPSETNWFARGQVTIDWDAVFPPAQAVQTTTTLAASPTGTAVEGANVELTATVSPAAAGTVVFAADNESLGQTSVVDGVAEISTGTLDVGARTITASFTPIDPAAFTASASDALSYEITAKPVQPATPTVVVSKTTGLDPAGETVTVTGSGFTPNAPATTGTRPPLAGKFGGAYVVFGSFADVWQPSKGAASTARKVVSQKWGVHAADMPTIGGANAGAIEIAADGTFSAELVITEDDTKALADGNWGVYTYPASGAAYAPFETATPISFAAPVDPEPLPTPTLTVTPNTDVDPDGATLKVEGRNYAKTSGFALRFGWVTETWKPSEGAANAARPAVVFTKVSGDADADANVQWTDNGDGTVDFSWTVDVNRATADAKRPAGSAQLGVFTFGNAATDGVQPAHEIFVPVTWKTVAPQPEPAKDPKVTVTPTADLDPSVTNVLTVSATGFFGPSAANGAYVLFGEKSTWNGQGALPSSGWIAQGHVASEKNGGVKNGAFTFELIVPAGKLDPAKEYVVVTSAAHGLSIFDRSLDTFTPVTVAQPLKPTIGLSVGEVRAGEALTVSGYGFTAGDPVVVTVNSDPFTLGTATVAADGRFSVTGTIPASFATGAHTVTVAVNGVVLASQALTVTAAAVVPTVEAPQAASCVARSVSGATIQWGVKESFRSYITGPIANGQISGGWGGGSGAYSTENDRGRVSFGGSMNFTGHGGLLDVSLSNPRIQVTGPNSASLILNVQSKGYNGSADVNANGVVFATLSLPAASESANRISWNGASATLTAAGAEAFAGFYNAGDALDAVSFAFPLGAEVPCDTTTDATLAATGGEAPVNTVWLGAAALLIGALAISIARRRRVEA